MKRACLVLSVYLFVTNAFALVSVFIEFKNEKNDVVHLWADEHQRGSIGENHDQLKVFVEKFLSVDKVHLVIESKFFFDLNENNRKTPSELSELLREHYECEGQDFSQSPTWISWDLPMVLMAITNNTELPNNIVLSPQQLQHIKENISFEFVDPRLHIEYTNNSLQVVASVADQSLENFKKAVRSSPTKINNIISNFAESQCLQAKEGNMTSIDHLFDVNAFSAIIRTLTKQSNEEMPRKKIVVLCGNWHAYSLNALLPLLSFSQRKQFSLAARRPDIQPRPGRVSVARKLNFDEEL